MKAAVLTVAIALGTAVGCTDNPVSPSTVQARPDAFRNRLVSRPESENPCVDTFYYYYPACVCYAPCVPVPWPPPHSRPHR
jgi:hypothetical protein